MESRRLLDKKALPFAPQKYSTTILDAKSVYSKEQEPFCKSGDGERSFSFAIVQTKSGPMLKHVILCEGVLNMPWLLARQHPESVSHPERSLLPA